MHLCDWRAPLTNQYLNKKPITVHCFDISEHEYILHFVMLQSEAPPDASSGIVLLDGEYATNVVAPISYALGRRRGGGGEFDGALHVTNFRLVLQRTGRGKVCTIPNRNGYCL